MIVFERLVATYYYFLLTVKHFFRRRKWKYAVERDEDFGSVCLLTFGQQLFLFLLLGVLVKKYGINVSTTAAVFLISFVLITLFGQYLYFMKNRIRRRRILDQYAELDKTQKTIWGFIALAILVVPIIMFPILFSKSSY